MRRILFALAAFLVLATPARAADSTVAAMTAASALAGSELLYCVQGGADRKCTPSQAATYVFSLVSGDCTATSGGAITCLKTNGSAFGALATLSPGSGVATALGNSAGGAGGFALAGTTPPTGSAGGDLAGTYPNPTVKPSVGLSGTPTAPTASAGDNTTQIATDAFVTTAVNNAVAGVNPSIAVTVATTAAGNTSSMTYANGAGGIGATLTGPNNTATVIDGVTFTAVGQSLLVKNDTQSPSGAFNGIYSLTALHTGITGDIFTRRLDYDQPSDINNTGAIPVVSGTANASTSWLLTSSVTTVGTDPLTYTQFTINPAKGLPLATGSSTGNVVTAPVGYFICTGTCTVTPPVPAAGYRFCVMNDDNVATVITLGAIGSSALYEKTARNGYGTAGTGTMTSGGSIGDMICILGRDSTHYLTPTFVGIWTAS